VDFPCPDLQQVARRRIEGTGGGWDVPDVSVNALYAFDLAAL